MQWHTKYVPVSQVLAVLAALLVTLCLAGGEDLTEQCSHFGSQDCPERGCRVLAQLSGEHAILCCNMYEGFTMKESISTHLSNDTNITALHIRNVSVELLDVSFLKNPQLVSLAITDSGRLTSLTNQLNVTTLACLNLSANALASVSPNMLLLLPSLQYLDVSHNRLSLLPKMPQTNGTLAVDMFDNDDVVCHDVKEMMVAQKHLDFQRRGETKCSTERDHNWFNSTYHQLLTYVELIDSLELMCPRGEGYNCTCRFHRMVEMVNQRNELSKNTVAVDCSNQNLTKLPDSLPNNTEVININNNFVTSLAPLANNPAYRDVRFVYANNNSISSILDLEGSIFIKSFNLLELQRNHFKTVPTYIFYNAFDRVANVRLLLGYNRFHCDCPVAKGVKRWLVVNKPNIPDVEKVLCEDSSKVLELDSSVVCVTQPKWTDYISYIIAAEVLLLVAIVSKVSYDYWVFKSTGYLPWIASKMPKMPCDWVFEA